MAHHKSALKRIRQSQAKKLYNRLNKKMLKEAIKSVRTATVYEDAVAKFQKATSILDRVSSRGIIHKNNAANKKSSLSAHVKSLKA